MIMSGVFIRGHGVMGELGGDVGGESDACGQMARPHPASRKHQ